MTQTEIIKEKLKGCEKLCYDKEIVKRDIICGQKYQLKKRGRIRTWLCEECKATLSGMQTAIKSELEFLECFDDFDYCKKCKLCKKARDSLTNEITDCKNALGLIKEK